MFKMLTENWALKLLSLVFALILWFFVMGERKLERSYAVPLEMKNIPGGMMVANEVPSRVDVRINGPRTLLMNLHAEDMPIVVDLKELPVGLTSFKRLEERLNIPAPLKVTRLSPSYIDVKLDRVETVKVPVKPVLSGRPASGLWVVKVTTDPDSAVVEGAAEELDALQQIETVPVRIEGIGSNVVEVVPLDYSGKFSWLKSPENVEIKITVGPKPDAL
jgi:YbbR domain-containing protein